MAVKTTRTPRLLPPPALHPACFGDTLLKTTKKDHLGARNCILLRKSTNMWDFRNFHFHEFTMIHRWEYWFSMIHRWKLRFYEISLAHRWIAKLLWNNIDPSMGFTGSPTRTQRHSCCKPFSPDGFLFQKWFKSLNSNFYFYGLEWYYLHECIRNQNLGYYFFSFSISKTATLQVGHIMFVYRWWQPTFLHDQSNNFFLSMQNV